MLQTTDYFFHCLIWSTQSLADAVVESNKSKNPALLTNREPTALESMAIATPILSMRLIEILTETERVVTHSGHSSAQFSPHVIVGDLQKCVWIFPSNPVTQTKQTVLFSMECLQNSGAGSKSLRTLWEFMEPGRKRPLHHQLLILKRLRTRQLAVTWLLPLVLQSLVYS